jgi:hypothetical protein
MAHVEQAIDATKAARRWREISQPVVLYVILIRDAISLFIGSPPFDPSTDHVKIRKIVQGKVGTFCLLVVDTACSFLQSRAERNGPGKCKVAKRRAAIG